MASEADIIQLSNGSRFYRADLHIHSHGASHDVSDVAMTPQAIVKTAIDENLNVIALADHNEISNVQAAIAAADQTSLYVVPAVELSTPQGHLLCYLPTFDALQSFFGRLSLVERGTPTSRCQNAVLDCLQHLDELNGFGILAHVDAARGFETDNPGNSPHICVNHTDRNLFQRYIQTNIILHGRSPQRTFIQRPILPGLKRPRRAAAAITPCFLLGA
jgi:hypothetical protein